MIDWKKYFDHIYCIHFLQFHNERFDRINNELKRVGILDSGIFSWKYTIDCPYYDTIRKNSRYKHEHLKQSKGAFNCGFAHYELMKEASYLKYDKVLFLEEDIVFLKNLEIIYNILENIPNTDIVLFDKFVYNPYLYQNVLLRPDYRLSKYFCKFDNTCGNFGSTASYCLTLKAITTFYEQQEYEWYCADELWNDWKDNINCNQLTKSFAILNLGYQKRFETCISIHNNIELAYKFINLDKSMYC